MFRSNPVTKMVCWLVNVTLVLYWPLTYFIFEHSTYKGYRIESSCTSCKGDNLSKNNSHFVFHKVSIAFLPSEANKRSSIPLPLGCQLNVSASSKQRRGQIQHDRYELHGSAPFSGIALMPPPKPQQKNRSHHPCPTTHTPSSQPNNKIIRKAVPGENHWTHQRKHNPLSQHSAQGKQGPWGFSMYT